MFPTRDQIERAAYGRWERRGGGHGQDRDDWVAAERDLVFAMNYEVIARLPPEGTGERSPGDEDRRRCRFCERRPPQATFEGARPAPTAFLGETPLRAYDECTDCTEAFRGIEGEFRRFLASCRAPGRGGSGASPASRLRVPVGAYKYLTKMGLSILPEAEIPAFEDTIEWVSNPDHDFDLGLFVEIGCYVYFAPEPFPTAWAALARRVEDDAPFPYMLFFLGTGDVAFQTHLPLCLRDEDLDGMRVGVPRVTSPSGAGPGDGESRCVVVPLATPG